MALHIEDKWVWDFWFARKGADTHIFYLQAPRSLGNPDLRHWHCSIGHAVSRDLQSWDILPDVLFPSEHKTAWDSRTTWTGSILKHDEIWYMFYTGTSEVEKGLIQRIGLATSDDLITWNKHAENPIMESDPRWYELLDEKIWHEQAWRDPWVFEQDGMFHAFITARVNKGHSKDRGVIGYARSNDLLNWEVQAPITQPGEFAYLEVPQLVKINRRWYLLFCVESDKFSESREKRKGVEISTGTHYMMADDPFGPYSQPQNDLLFGDQNGTFYSGKLIQNQSGAWMFLTAIQYDQEMNYVGDISDPLPVSIHNDGQISVLNA